MQHQVGTSQLAFMDVLGREFPPELRKKITCKRRSVSAVPLVTPPRRGNGHFSSLTVARAFLSTTPPTCQLLRPQRKM
jgi:hypothetical protein